MSEIGIAGTNGTNGQGVAAGGTAGQALTKIDGTDYNTTWTTIGGGTTQALAYVAKTGTYTITTSDYTVNCTSGSFVITLPTAVGTSGVGQVYVIKNTGTGTITINTTSSQTIDGYASGAITLAQYDALRVQSTNANWIVI